MGRFFSLSFLSLFVWVLSGVQGAETLPNVIAPKLLDGSFVKAVEDYPAPALHEINLGLSVFPFDPYNQAIGIKASYDHHINEHWGWEVVDASYYFNFDKGFIAELAAQFSKTPSNQIGKLQYLILSNATYSPAFGKVLFFDQYIRQFKMDLVFGGGLVNTSTKSRFGLNAGGRVNFFISDRFSWSITAEDTVAVNPIANFVTFHLQSGMHF